MGHGELGAPGWGHEGMLADMLVPLLGMVVPLLFLAGVALVTILLLRRAQLADPGTGSRTASPAQAIDPALRYCQDN